jgi:lantibiotic modifying enzyme
MSWEPLLEGALKARAEESVQAIVGELPTLEPDPAVDPSLAGGAAGQALLHSYVAQCKGGSGHAALAGRHLYRAISAAADSPTSASLYSGLTGVGWALAHLRGRLPDLDGEDDLAAIDEALLSHLDQSPWRDDYDLVSGLAGFGVYALERLPGPAALACLERVVERLAETAEHRPDGITWWTNPAWLPAVSRQQFPKGYYNLGMAHGVPGVIALLGQVCAASVAVPEARSLLDGAVRWLLTQQRPEGFRHWAGPGGTDRPARLAWCYGDPGIAAALFLAARCVGEPAWEREARAITRRAAERPAEQAGVVDAGLCHGACGLGHLFNRLFQATGDPTLAEAARAWFARALVMRGPGLGVGGFEAWGPGGDGASAWVADPGLLTGAVGIALALLAAANAVEPAWDRMLMVDVPPEPASGRWR